MSSQPTDHDSDTVEAELESLVASNAAFNGNLDEAESILLKEGRLPGSCSALDLLARIKIQRGQFAVARELWLEVLAREPGNKFAQAALARLASPWLRLALGRRAVALAGMAVLLCLALIGFSAVVMGSGLVGHTHSKQNGSYAVNAFAAQQSFVSPWNLLTSLPEAEVSIRVIPSVPLFAEGGDWAPGGEEWMLLAATFLAEAKTNYFIRSVVRATPEERQTIPDVISQRKDKLSQILNEVQATATVWATGTGRDIAEGRTPYFGLVRKTLGDDHDEEKAP